MTFILKVYIQLYVVAMYRVEDCATSKDILLVLLMCHCCTPFWDIIIVINHVKNLKRIDVNPMSWVVPEESKKIILYCTIEKSALEVR